jgi:two-component system chemotaxis sensor kinase CheA
MELDLELVQSFCDEALDTIPKWEAVCLELAKAPKIDLFENLFRHAHNLKGGARSVGLQEFGDAVHKIEDGITLLRDGKVELNDDRLSLLLQAQNLLADWAVEAMTNPSFCPDHESFFASYQKAFSGQSEEPVSLVTTPEQSKSSAPAMQAKAKPKVAAAETLRINAAKLDHLLQVVGELSIHQSIIWHTRGDIHNSNKLFQNSVQLSQKLTKELYDRALSLRMQPIQSVFQRLERNILDLSKSLGKSVNVVVTGGDVELDKMVIEKIVDPLTHIVRNAIDHGVETEEIREQSGKSRTGNIEICAKQDTFGIELIIRDDGKGLNSEKILQKALEKGIVGKDKSLSQKEIFNLIFLPSFSTAEKVTDVSGRGVGMDVVRRSLEELQGSIAIDSNLGQGTTFTITLPTSVSIIDSILISLGGEKYVIPVDSIVEVINLSGRETELSKDMIIHNGAVLPIYDVETVLSRNTGKLKKNLEKKAILVCRDQSNRIGLLIDQVVGQQQVVIRPLNENITGSFGLLGGTVLGNGEPGLIVDIPILVKHFIQKSGAREMAA